MRAVVVSHDPSEQPGLVGARLVHHGYALEPFVVCADVDEPVSHAPFPAIDGADLLVVMGAPWSVYDHHHIGSWIGRELAWLRDAHHRGVPVLGICFGAQALAAALGGNVHRGARAELGWLPVDTDVPHLVPPGPWFQWHRDYFEVPPDAVELARTDVGVQAYRVGRSLGVQFHPEVDDHLLDAWLDGPLDPLFGELGVHPAALIDEAVRNRARSVSNAHVLVDAFLEEVAR